ncbi:AAA family ATPase [Pseudoalteromonas ardens]|uniref:AAA family ATPase n=1 Tax=Pseudoalteromonas ardens TaxID=3048490 RepID=UPI0024C295CF|nr:AAA family ATPase [Pseudoalteromonas sp. R96]MDK1312295.1 AAA family ATPase [Pseudoalteromonas sp. R96]
MRLSSIKLAGFKSFVEPTKIPFPEPMTCVVGPNGCGKSNVIDAVRWVLGESSAKNLRGDAMTDVIFNGSTHRKPVSQASVELLFDNTQGRLPGSMADRTQVAIKRLVTRDGQSLYFLNGSKCRKRDITDIFLGTGLGPRSYAIIEQGMISRLIESKPQELRIFLEEAAGVSKYKERRRETQTRIKSTRENLERLLDMRQELQNQLDRLSKQADAARQYRDLKAQERTLKGQLAVLKWQELHARQQEKTTQITKLNEQLTFLEQAHGGHDDVLATCEQQVTHFSEAQTQLQQQLHTTQTQLTRLEQQKIHLGEKRRDLVDKQTKLNEEIAQAQTLYEQQQQHCAELAEQAEIHQEAAQISAEKLAEAEILNEEKIQQLQASEAANQQNQQVLEQARQHVQQCQLALQRLTQQQQHLTQQQAQLAQQLAQHGTQNPAEALAQQQKAHQELVHAMAISQQENQRLSAELNRLNEAKAALQQQVQTQQVKLGQVQAQVQALEKLTHAQQGDSEDAPGASLLSALRVEPGREQVVERAMLGLGSLRITEQDYVNRIWASTKREKAPNSVAMLVHSDVYPEFLNQIEWLGEARHFSAHTAFFAAIDDVGNLYGHNWRAQETDTQSENLLAHYSELRAHQAALPEIEARLSELEAALGPLETSVLQCAEQLETNKQAVHEAAKQVASSQTRVDMLVAQQTSWQQQSHQLERNQHELAEQSELLVAQLEESEQTLWQAEEAQELQQQQMDQASELLETLKRVQLQQQQQQRDIQQQHHQAKLKLQQVESDVQLGQTKLSHLAQALSQGTESLAQVQQQLHSCEEPGVELEQQQTELLIRHTELEQALQDGAAQLNEAKQQLSDKQLALKDAQAQSTKLKEQRQQLALQEQSLMVKAQAVLEPLTELRQTLKDVLAQLPEDAQASNHQGKLTRIAQQLSLLGAVNLAAIEEFDEAQQRKRYLDEQLDDLSAALETLEGAIRKIDRETRSRFKTTFDQVNQDLAELFPKVFGGGSAYLELTSDDLLESGVTIMARPPGKKNSTIHLLSGGEKALTALSLVFSIFRLNPAPFCMLDEVDAPLDDANVGRFCRLVEEMSQTVQFIYISHNKVAMEMAGRLTGVTMAEPGVSRMVAVDIEQAVQMAHA